MMDKFKLTLLLETIAKETKKTALKKIISERFRYSFPYYFRNEEYIYSSWSYPGLQTVKQNLVIMNAAHQRYLKLGYPQNDLPAYTNNMTDISVNIKVPLDIAIKTLKEYNE